MTDIAGLVQRLREYGDLLLQDAADVLEAQAKRIAELETLEKKVIQLCKKYADDKAFWWQDALAAFQALKLPEEGE